MSELESKEFQKRVTAELSQLHFSLWQTFCFKAQRFAIRSLRILIGAGLGLVVYWLLGKAGAVSDVPFARLTLGQLGGALFNGILAVGIGCLAYLIAFGEGRSLLEAEHVWRGSQRMTAELTVLRKHNRQEA